MTCWLPTAAPLAFALCLPLTGCDSASSDGDSASGGEEGILTSASGSGEEGGTDDEGEASSGSGDGCPDDGCLDIMGQDGSGTGVTEGGDTGDCEAPEHVPCDGDASNIITALGLNCPGEPIVNATVGGAPAGSGTLVAFGTTAAFAPTEGQRYAVIGSGPLSELPTPLGCSTDLGAFDPGTTLPAPIRTNDVGAVTCTDDPSLVGTGDCSNTINAQFIQAASGANDFTEIRFDVVVPEGVTSFSYDFAFLSTEYPVYYGSQFNDMYIGWLESEDWTGNISFDDQGNPISLNAGFMDYLDADAAAHPDCPTGSNCTAPELDGTCMDGHGATRWLSTNASVNPGENITVVFAIFDMGDSILDSYVFLDNFLWGCEGGQPPSTVPID